MQQAIEEFKRENLKISMKQSPDYHAGVREGRHQERGDWVQALSHMKEIDEALLGRIIGEVAKLYEGE